MVHHLVRTKDPGQCESQNTDHTDLSHPFAKNYRHRQDVECDSWAHLLDRAKSVLLHRHFRGQLSKVDRRQSRKLR